MPGTFATVYFVAFDLDGRDQAVQAFAPRVAASEAAAVEQARELGARRAGVVVWKREGRPAVGEEGEPEIVFSLGRIGDFDYVQNQDLPPVRFHLGGRTIGQEAV